MLARRKPSARRAPISRTRLATAACMVIIAPIIAPIEKTTESVSPSTLMKFESSSDCSS